MKRAATILRLAFVTLGLTGFSHSAIGEEYVFDVPSDDRWHYPFNFTPGDRGVMTCFSSVGNIVYPLFNDRDGTPLIAWETSEAIEPGLCPGAYEVDSVTVVLTNTSGAIWSVDLTTDEWFMFDFNNDGEINGDGRPCGSPGDVDGESDDPDGGRPIELFGVGFGERTSYETWTEFTPYFGASYNSYNLDGSGGGRNDPKDPFPFVYQEETLEKLHVEDSVKGTQNEDLDIPVFQFTPTPWAIGTPIDYTPGNQPVPFDVVFDVDLSLSDGAVEGYFQEQLSGGRVIVYITTLLETIVRGGELGSFPVFFSKEGAPTDPLGKAPKLIINVYLREHAFGDANDDCLVSKEDHAELVAHCLSGPGQTPVSNTTLCIEAFDGNGDGDIDLEDVAQMFRAYTGPF